MRRRYGLNNIKRDCFSLYHFNGNLVDEVSGNNASGGVIYGDAKFGEGVAATGTLNFPSDFLRELLAGDFTIDFWVRHTVLESGIELCFQWDGGALLYSAVRFQLYRNSPGLEGNIYLGYNTTSVRTIIPFSGIEDKNGLNHYALVRVGNLVTLYINGKNIGSVTYITKSISSDKIYNGVRGNTAYLDELCISDYAVWSDEFKPPKKEYRL